MSNRRYRVYMQSGRKFMVEEYGEPYVRWGNVIPGQDKLELVHCKMDEPIDDSNTQITKENGYKNIVMLDMGVSPLGYIEAIDKSGVQKFERLDCGKYLS